MRNHNTEAQHILTLLSSFIALPPAFYQIALMVEQRRTIKSFVKHTDALHQHPINFLKLEIPLRKKTIFG